MQRREKAARVWKQYKLDRQGSVSKRIRCGVSGLVVPWRWTDNRGCAGLSSLCWSETGHISFTFNFPVTWSAYEQVDSTARCNGESQDCVGGRGERRTRHCGAFSQRMGWVASLSLWHTETQTHSVTHCPRYQWSVQHTHTSCVHTRLSLWSSAAIQRCSAILLRRVINYSSRISALVRSWAW